MKILIIDDDRDIANLLSIYVKNEGYRPLFAYNGEMALKILDKNKDVALMILDLMLPKMNGIQVLKRVRAHSNLPIIILSAKATDMDKIKGLIGGADDYITKPFNPIEVMARVKSVLRRSHPQSGSSNKVIDAGVLKINRPSREVETITGKAIHLTASEFNILYLLASHPNHVFSAGTIFNKVWHDYPDSSSAETVMVHMSHLREKIIQATHDDGVIKTVWGVGYKMTD